MERMVVRILTVDRQGRQVIVKAYVVARRAHIVMKVWFYCAPTLSQAEILEQARDEVLRYLDPA
jgi:hypothetical protein